MRVLIQRVSRDAVRVDSRTVGSIGRGLMILLGVEDGDEERDADYLADKSAELRIFPDDAGCMNRSVEEIGGEVLVISQFTLAGSTRRGRRPSYSRAAEPTLARDLYEYFMQRLRERGVSVASGEFQAMMDVELVNEGPVTLLLDPPPFRVSA
ncbi:MAG: D-tyrosyl-tRNA(Tyr) deacylase [bacterium]|nr:D-tyrosyl-tRNA(Tyr) deacylase [bacterium]